MTLEAISKGAVPNPLSKVLAKYNGKAYWHPLKEEYRPYVAESFNWMYDRIGTGYEEQNDLSAEAEEMCRVIEALLP